MIILRQKNYTHGREYVALNKEKEIRPNDAAKRWNRECAVKGERLKRKIVGSAIDIVNNPAGAVADVGKATVSRPVNTAGKVLIAVPFPASVPAGVGVIAVGNQINKRVKPLGKLSKSINDGIEKSKIYRKIKGINLGIIKENPYKKVKVSKA